MISKLFFIENEHFTSIFPPAMYENDHFHYLPPSPSYTISNKWYAVALIYIFIINKIAHLFIWILFAYFFYCTIF